MRNPYRQIMSEGDKEKARIFADEVIGTVDYRDSRQGNKEKVWKDHRVSKIAEQGLANMCISQGIKVIGPDYKIYTGNDKNFSSDLVVGGVCLPVKTQCRSDARIYGLSWTFGSRVRKDRVIEKPDAWIAFTEVIDDDGSYDVNIFDAIQVKDLIFKEPKLEKLKGIKVVVYAADIFGKKFYII